MAHMWLMHDAHLGCAFLFLDSLAEYTLPSMTVMDSWLTHVSTLQYVVGMSLKLVMFYVKFPQAPFARAPFGEAEPHKFREWSVRSPSFYRKRAEYCFESTVSEERTIGESVFAHE